MGYARLYYHSRGFRGFVRWTNLQGGLQVRAVSFALPAVKVGAAKGYVSLALLK
jgi:hypothetical protein